MAGGGRDRRCATICAPIPSRVKACSDRIRVIKVNRKTLTLFEANDLPHLVANLDRVFRDDTFKTHHRRTGRSSGTADRVLQQHGQLHAAGRRLDIQLKGSILPDYEDNWERVLIAIEDVTERETARRRLAAARTMRAACSSIRRCRSGSRIFRRQAAARRGARRGASATSACSPTCIRSSSLRCMSEIRVIDVNRHTLELFGAPDKPTLLRRLGDIFRDDMQQHFREQLIDLWDGKLFQQREVVNYSLDGTELHLHLHSRCCRVTSATGRWCRSR